MKFPPTKVPPAGGFQTPREMLLERRVAELERENKWLRLRSVHEPMFNSGENIADPKVVAAPDMLRWDSIADWEWARPAPLGGWHVLGKTYRTGDQPGFRLSYFVTDMGLYGYADRLTFLQMLYPKFAETIAQGLFGPTERESG